MLDSNKRMKTLADWLHKRPSYVVLGCKPDGTYVGIVENSFSMSLSERYVNIFWSSETARDNIVGAIHVVNGEEDAQHHCKNFSRGHPEIQFSVYDLNSPDCPIDIDWKRYLISWTPDPKKLSGVKDKFGARNPDFYLKVPKEAPH